MGFIAIALGLIFCAAHPALGITGGEIMEKVQERLEGYKTFSARFEKQFYWAVLDKGRSREGRIYMRRPDRFRVELEDGDLVVADGQAIWAYVQRNRQVVVSPYQGELKTPWQIFGDYAGEYAPLAVEETELGGRPCYLLVLKPQKPASAVVQMRVWVGRKDWLLFKVEQVEVNGNTTTYILKDHRTNKKIDDEVFRFVVPEGVEVLDQRQAGPRDE